MSIELFAGKSNIFESNWSLEKIQNEIHLSSLTANIENTKPTRRRFLKTIVT